MTLRWRLILLIALTWLFIYAGPRWLDLLASRPACQPLRPISCEP